MFYVYPNGSSGWSISVEPPINQEYYEFETLPDGDGTIVYRDGELVRVPPVEPEQSGNEYNAFLEGLMEGYQNG